MSKILFIIRGLPGAGKTTLANLLTDYYYEADQFMINNNGEYEYNPAKINGCHALCKEHVQAAMEAEVDKIAVSNTSTRLWEVQDYLCLAEQFGYQVFSLVVENRHGSKSIHKVPSEANALMKDRFEVLL